MNNCPFRCGIFKGLYLQRDMFVLEGFRMNDGSAKITQFNRFSIGDLIDLECVIKLWDRHSRAPVYLSKSIPLPHQYAKCSGKITAFSRCSGHTCVCMTNESGVIRHFGWSGASVRWSCLQIWRTASTSFSTSLCFLPIYSSLLVMVWCESVFARLDSSSAPL